MLNKGSIFAYIHIILWNYYKYRSKPLELEAVKKGQFWTCSISLFAVKVEWVVKDVQLLVTNTKALCVYEYQMCLRFLYNGVVDSWFKKLELIKC